MQRAIAETAMRFPGAPRRREARGELLEWAIVGGGIHGTYLAQFLLNAIGVSPDRLRIIDRYELPLHRWRRVTANVGMEFLRSAAVHHLDLPSLSLKRFPLDEQDRRLLTVPPLLPPYDRPALLLFNRHAESVVRNNAIDSLLVPGQVGELRSVRGGYELVADGSTVRARRVLLAIGASDQPCWPEWARMLKARGGRVYHVLDSSFARSDLSGWRSAIVYGGGLSAAQLAVALAKERPGAVTMVMRHELRVHLFDSEPSWQGQNFMRAFALESSPAKRREIINRERHRGSLTPEAKAELDRAVAANHVRLVRMNGEPAALQNGERIELHDHGEHASAEMVILATGYDRARPGGEWLDRAIAKLKLPVAPCGYPVVDPSLQWRNGLFVTGPLAELELGPVARNISGAHRAAARLEYLFRDRS